MTLVQVVADEVAIHMACDFMLTDAVSREPRQYDAHKLMYFQRPPLSAFIGFTGVAVLDGKPAADWITEVLGNVGFPAQMEDILDALSQAPSAIDRLKYAADPRLSFVVGGFVGSQSRIALVSNFEVFAGGRVQKLERVAAAMKVSGIKPKSPQFFAFGDTASISKSERNELTLALRSGASDNHIKELLQKLNEAVSKRTDTVSAGCYTASLHATGLGNTKPFLTGEQTGDFIVPELSQMFKKLGVSFKHQTDAYGREVPIRVVQTAVLAAGNSHGYYREQLKLRPDSDEVWNNYGVFLAKERNFDGAIAAFEKARNIAPLNMNALGNLAAALSYSGNDTERVTELYEEAIASAEPKVPTQILSDYAVLCADVLKDNTRAAGLHEQAAQDENYPLAKARYGWFLFDSGGDRSKASTLFDQALAKQPGNAEVLRLSAAADFLSGSHDLACEKLHKACSHAPRDVNILRTAADICLTVGDSASASYYYRKIIGITDSDVQARANYGLALLNERKFDGAIRQLNAAAVSDLGARVKLAAALWATGDRRKSLKLIDALLNSDLPVSIELELMTVLQVADPSRAAITQSRLRELVAARVVGDGLAVRCMTRGQNKEAKEEGELLAMIVEGDATIPESWR